MKTFLTEVIEDLIAQKTDFRHTTLIIPGVRPKAFIRKTFVDLGYTGMLPEMKTIEEFLEEISGLKMLSGVPLWFAMYEAYLSKVEEPKTLEDFLKFATTLLKDFDDIDASLCDDKTLLDNLISEERIKKWGKSMDVGLSDIMQNHLGFWTEAQAIFYTLRNNLLEEGKAYRGLLARQASQEVDIFIERTQKFFVFIGFNALTNAEQKIVEHCLNKEKATAYWDADKYYLHNYQQEAGDFLRQYKQRFKDFKFVNNHFEQEKKLKIVNVPKQETQAKYVGNLLREISEEQRQKTAIVLADEQLLPSVLNALPNEVEKLNITMGLPLNMVPIASFFREIFNLHLNREKFKKGNSYYYKGVIKVINHLNFRNCFAPQASDLIKEINELNIVFIGIDKLTKLTQENPFYSLFLKPETPTELLSIVIDWINYLNENQDLDAVQQEYLFRFRSVFMQLKDLLNTFPYVENFKTLYQLYQQLLQAESVSFMGEPLVGLQLLGMLETRLLDFEHIILTSVNEGTLPLGRQENSFIPFDFRKDAGLNTFLENDAIYAYHFYRLIQRCKSAVIMYNSDSEGLGSGEQSRFLMQLKLESKHKIDEVIATPNYDKSEQTLIEIPKTKFVLKQLEQWKDKISPSSLGTYLWNPLDFYEQKILKLYSEDEVEETAGDRTLGIIIHDTLEELYKPYLNQILTPEIFKNIEKVKEKTFKKITEDKLLKGNDVRGKNILILKVAEEMISNVLNKDKMLCKDNELIIKLVEEKYDIPFTTPAGNKVNFIGLVDRIDELNGQIRMLDYKTGSVDARTLNWSDKNIEKLIENHGGAKAIQLAIYAYMFLNASNFKQITSGIYPLRYFGNDVEFLNWNKNNVFTLESLTPFMEKIGDLIDEILQPESPFRELEE